MIETERESIDIPLGDATEAALRIEFGGGELAIGAAPPGMLVEGDAPGAIVEHHGPARLRIRPAPPTIDWRPLHWRLGLTAQVPLDLILELGGDRSGIDLSHLRVRRLHLETGASDTRIRLPETGPTSVHVACGLALVTLEVPFDTEARIRGRLVLGATEVDEHRFPRAADGWASPEATTGDETIDITIEGALGTIRVV